jgi:hypothetical protein
VSEDVKLWQAQPLDANRFTFQFEEWMSPV